MNKNRKEYKTLHKMRKKFELLIIFKTKYLRSERLFFSQTTANVAFISILTFLCKFIEMNSNN